MKPAPSTESIDLARYAEVTAYLRQFPAEHKDEVIARLGLRRRVWEAESAKWTSARDAELASGKADIATRFGSVFTRTRQRLAALRPPLESIGTLPGPDDLEPEAEPSPPESRKAPLPPEEIAAPAPVVHLMPGLDMPASKGPSLWARHASFAGREPVHPIAPIPLARLAPEASPAPVAAWSPVALPPQPVLVKRSGRDLGSTAPIGANMPVSPLMPFQAAGSTPAQAYDRAVAHAQAVQGSPESARGTSDLGSTVALGNDLPTPPLPPGVPDLTLPQYASLRVELHVNPGNAALILATYRVTAEGHPTLDAHWRARFKADPLQRMMFARAYASYSLWLKQNSPAKG